jgi:hypothetical protein
VAKIEGEVAEKLTEVGVTPTKDETSCMVNGLESIVSESEALSNKTPTSQQNQEIEEITTGCLGEATAATGSTEVPEASENQGLQEMDEELQQEYEEEGHTP